MLAWFPRTLSGGTLVGAFPIQHVAVPYFQLEDFRQLEVEPDTSFALRGGRVDRGSLDVFRPLFV